MNQGRVRRSGFGRELRGFGPARSAAIAAYAALIAVGALAVWVASAGAAPTVSILSPSEGASIDSGTVPLSLDIQNLTLNGSAIGQAPVTGEGHFHLYLDGTYVKAGFTGTTFLADVPEGVHSVLVELANNDHTLLGANATVNVTVLAGAPRVKILSPAASSAWMSSSVELRISKDNFTYNPGAVGQAAVAGEGHYHVFVNGGYFFYGTTEFFNVTYLDIGKAITIRVELANNDHTLLSDATFDEVQITTAAGAKELKLAPSLFQAQVNASSLEAGFTLGNFTINPSAVGQPAVPGEGHYHVWLDGALQGPASAPTVKLTGLSVGPHTLTVELRNNDHTPLAPRVVDFTLFTVVAGAPRVEIVSPTDPSTVNATSLDLAIAVGNFTLDGAKMGQANVAGEGHWHVSVDGVLLLMGGDLRIPLFGLTAGPHIIEVELASHDHSDLPWPVFDILRVVVPAGAPSIDIQSPAAGSTVALNWTAVAVTVVNFTLAPDRIGQAATAGEGHWHVFVDGAYVGNSATLTGLAPNLSPGTHTVRVELRNNDHSALSSPAFDEVSVTVTGLRPSIAITGPADGAVIYGNSTTVTVQVANFTLDPAKIGQAAVIGEGHWHVFVDGVYVGASATTSASVAGLAAGHHVLKVALHNNDHTALLVEVSASVEVHVAGVPRISILSPAAGLVTQNTTLTVEVELMNFTLVAVGSTSANEPGAGHLHVLVDGADVAMVSSTSFTVSNLSVGAHTIRVVLANNDHSPFTAGQNQSQVSVTVEAAPAPAPPRGFLPGFGLLEAVAAVGGIALVGLAVRRRRLA